MFVQWMHTLHNPFKARKRIRKYLTWLVHWSGRAGPQWDPLVNMQPHSVEVARLEHSCMIARLNNVCAIDLSDYVIIT